MFSLTADSGKICSSEFTAGILVEKDGVRKLTVAAHAFDEEFKEQGDKLGNEDRFILYQGNHKAQFTKVGNVDEVISANGEYTDIALASLASNINFSNELFYSFKDQKIVPQTFLSLNDCKFLDKFMIESCMTGFQKLVVHGLRFPLEKKGRNPMQDIKTKGLSPDRLPNPALQYLRLTQGMYSTGAIEIPTKPQIRAGVCGSAVIRFQKKGGPVDPTPGEVAGFMHFSDIEPLYSTEGRLLCYADSCDPLIEQGWTIAKC